MLLAVGGMDKTESNKKVESYDIPSGIWSQHGDYPHGMV